MATRSILGLLYASKAYEDMGVDPNAIFSQHGLPLGQIDETALIERAKELEVITDLFRLKPDPKIGLLMGPKMGLAGYGPLTMLMMTCENAYEACQMGIKYQELAYLFGSIHVELGPEFSSLVLEQVMLPDEIATFLLYRDMAGTLKFVHDIQQMNGIPLEVKEVSLKIPKPDNLDGFKQAFGCPVRFDQPRNTIVMPTRFLKAPYNQANKTAFNIYREQCDQQLAKANQIPEAISELLNRYLRMFVYKVPTVSEAARTFGFSERSFRRQLNKENTNYQHILDNVRFEKAQYWLTSSQLNIDGIASKLGYQEAAAFNHAFKRWAGCTPSQYRKRHSVNI